MLNISSILKLLKQICYHFSFTNYGANIGVNNGFRGEVLELTFNKKKMGLHFGSIDYKSSAKMREYGKVNKNVVP